MGGHLEGRSPQQSRRELETPDASLGGSMDEETAVRPHGGMPRGREVARQHLAGVRMTPQHGAESQPGSEEPTCIVSCFTTFEIKQS